ncbi:MAG: phage holin family protein [Ramlibacter sp.]|nr:phage holin family protein [Ramlibacter sp.]
MVHPVFTVLITRPELVMDHVAGYAALVQEEASSLGVHVAQRVLAWCIAIVALLVFLVLAGVAVMLGAMNDEFSWALVLTPVAALVVGLVAVAFAKRKLPSKGFTELKAQLDADSQALRTIGASS